MPKLAESENKMKTTNCNGEEIEIATLQEHEDGERVRVDTLADFELCVKAMGWESTAQFEEETGVTAQELLGFFWCVVHDRVYTD